MIVGMFGGSFDPFHKGHLQGCRAALDKGCDIVLCLPSASHADKKNLLPMKVRMEIIKKSIPPELANFVFPSNFESEMEVNNGPIHTGLVYEALEKIVSPHELVFVVGADITPQYIETWPHAKKIRKIMTVPRVSGYSSSSMKKFLDLSQACNPEAAELIRQNLFS